jgi:hypothetical protein
MDAPLISKQVLMSNFEGLGFETKLFMLNKGDKIEKYGEVHWGDIKFTKVYIGDKISNVDPAACDLWAVTNNFARLREIAELVIKHLAGKGKPVIAGGSDIVAVPHYYLAAGANAVVLDKSGTANGAVLNYLLGESTQDEPAGVMLAGRKYAPKKFRPSFDIDKWPLPTQSVVKQCLGAEYRGFILPKGTLIGSVFPDIGCDRRCDFCQTPRYHIGYRAMSPKRTLQWFESQKKAGATMVMNASDQFLGRVLKKRGRQDVIDIMEGIQDMELGVMWFNGFELKKLTRGLGKTDGKIKDLDPDEEFISAIFDWNGKAGCYLAYVAGERPLVGQKNYKKLMPWQQHCEILRAIARTTVAHIHYGIIIGFEDDSNESLSRLEEALYELYEDMRRENSALKFQIAAMTLSPIPSTPQAEIIRNSGLLQFDEPSLYGTVWTPTMNTRYLSYKQIVDWQERFMRIGSGQFMDFGRKVE